MLDLLPKIPNRDHHLQTGESPVKIAFPNLTALLRFNFVWWAVQWAVLIKREKSVCKVCTLSTLSGCRACLQERFFEKRRLIIFSAVVVKSLLKFESAQEIFRQKVGDFKRPNLDPQCVSQRYISKLNYFASKFCILQNFKITPF